MRETFKGFKFCEVLDSLLSERTRLTTMKVVTNYSGAVYWLHRFLVNRALTQNLRQIKIHECSLCQASFRDPRYCVPEKAYQLVEQELMILQESVQACLKHEIEEDGALD